MVDFRPPAETGLKARLCAAILLLVLAAGCARVPPLAGAHRSPEHIARAALQAIEQRDRAALEALALSETEFRDHIWPELPAARPERNLPFSYVWGDLRQKSEASLLRTLREHGGRRYQLGNVRFERKTAYGSYTVHRDTTLSVIDDTWKRVDVRLFGSVVEKDGEWKVFSYVVDD